MRIGIYFPLNLRFRIFSNQSVFPLQVKHLVKLWKEKEQERWALSYMSTLIRLGWPRSDPTSHTTSVPVKLGLAKEALEALDPSIYIIEWRGEERRDDWPRHLAGNKKGNSSESAESIHYDLPHLDYSIFTSRIFKYRERIWSGSSIINSRAIYRDDILHQSLSWCSIVNLRPTGFHQTREELLIRDYSTNYSSQQSRMSDGRRTSHDRFVRLHSRPGIPLVPLLKGRKLC